VCQRQKVKALSLALSFATQGAVSTELKAEGRRRPIMAETLCARAATHARHDVDEGGEGGKGEGGRVVANGCSSAPHAGGGREAGSSEGLCRKDRVGVRVADRNGRL
jgi:hypothetical protein